MSEKTLTTKELDNFRTDGERATADLAKMAEALGYGGFPQQLQFNNGCFVSSILNFFEDNPGAVEALHDWVRENYAQDLEANDADDENEDGGDPDESEDE